MNKDRIIELLYGYLKADDKNDTNEATEYMTTIRFLMHKAYPEIQQWEE